jgi:hypothetical protein
MKFRIEVTSGGEVIFEGQSRADMPVYYGASPEPGLWRISIPKLEGYISEKLAQHSFGSSIEEFVFGFEIAELEEWGRWFRETREYMSYRPLKKSFISVGQVEWQEVKALQPPAQLGFIGAALLSSVERIGIAKRKPKDFDHLAFVTFLRGVLSACDVSQVTV